MDSTSGTHVCNNSNRTGQVKLRGRQPVKLYNREDAKRILVDALREAAEKYARS